MPTIGLLSDHASDEIPASHRDLVECPPVAALTTVMPDRPGNGTRRDVVPIIASPADAERGRRPGSPSVGRFGCHRA